MSPPLLPKGAGGKIHCNSNSINHRRRLVPQGGRAWASLPEDLVELIGWRVLAGDLLDYVRFRAVCAHWSSSTACPRGRGLVDPRFHPRSWMLLPEGGGLYPGHPDLGGHVRFFNLSTGVFVRVHLPLFDDHVVLDSPDGLLLLLRHRDRGTAVRLLHPFTGDIAELPSLSSLLSKAEPNLSDDRSLLHLRNFLRGVCAAVTVTAAGAITVMLTIKMGIDRVAHAAAGDLCWTLSSWRLPWFNGTMAFRGKLYGVLQSCPGPPGKTGVSIHQIDPPQPSLEGSHRLSLQPPRRIAECPLLSMIGRVGLVECGSEIMVVGFIEPSWSHLVVYKLTDLTRGRICPVMNIGEHAFFLGERSICVSHKGLPSIPSNSITSQFKPRPLFVNGSRGKLGPSVEQYDLGSGTWSRATDEDMLCYRRPLTRPYMLIHHIYTCCHRICWNKGLVVCERTLPNWSVKPNLWIGDAEIATSRFRGRTSASPSRMERERARMRARMQRPK